jgi:hypothetical protein
MSTSVAVFQMIRELEKRIYKVEAELRLERERREAINQSVMHPALEPRRCSCTD